MFRRSLSVVGLTGALLTAPACTSGPGRVPTFADAAERFDGGSLDANPRPDARPDAGPPDDSEVELFDSGFVNDFPFTGQYIVQGDQNRLFAREAAGRLSIILGGAPFVYEGTIQPNGDVDVISSRLARSGCAVPRITGSYQRMSATLFLTLYGCGQDGAPFQTELRGGFEVDFDHEAQLGFAGLYNMAAVIMNDGGGCYSGPVSVMEMLWAVNMRVGDNTIAIHVAHDLIPTQSVYIGRLELPDFRFAAVENVLAVPGAFDVSMRGNLTRAGTDPPTIVGTRDVYDPIRQCNFSIGFQGRKFSNF